MRGVVGHGDLNIDADRSGRVVEVVHTQTQVFDYLRALESHIMLCAVAKIERRRADFLASAQTKDRRAIISGNRRRHKVGMGENGRCDPLGGS